jgi:hypothetical protein
MTRPTHIEDYLVKLHTNQWFTWTDSKNKVYANLKLTDKIGVNGSMVDNPVSSLPSESDCTTGLSNMQTAWDLEHDSYKSNRRADYPQIAEQFDLLYKDIVAGTVTTNGDFAKAIKAVKDKYTKE